MSVLSRLGIAASQLDFEVKRFLRGLLATSTIAAAGADQTDATAITTGRVMVTAADGAKGVILPVAEVDMAVEIVNTVSNQDLLVYPNTGAQINALTVTTGAFTLGAGQSAIFYCDAALHWYVRAASITTGVATSASTAELDVLDGALATNLVAAKAAITTTNGGLTLGGSVTAVGSFIIGAADMNETDLEKLDGITNGTQAANKAVVADANVNIGAVKATSLAVGVSGSEVAIDATPLEINRAADVSTRLVAAGATEAITVAAHDGKTVLLDTAGGSVCTLPVAAATGARIRFAVTVRPSGGSHIIKVGNASDFIAGQIDLLDLDSSAQASFQGDGAADDTITINNTTTGGAIGDYIELEDTLANVWTVVHGQLTVPTGSNPVDPFSATV
jgi:hypothetical protein